MGECAIAGIVQAQDRHPLVGVRVKYELYSYGFESFSTLSDETFTDANGHFTFAPIALRSNDQVIVRARLSEFVPQSKMMTAKIIWPACHIDFELVPATRVSTITSFDPPRASLDHARSFRGTNTDWEPTAWPLNEVNMMLVPSGCFQMGSETGWLNEGPVTETCLDTFWISQTEVTNAQYRTCVEAGGCELPEYTDFYDIPTYADYPVVSVNWHQAYDYAAWIGGRLPTEAEWEYACRGPASWIYPWGDSEPTCEQANVRCLGTIGPVGPNQRPAGASWVGVLDMSGNVNEWTNSVYGIYPYTATDDRENRRLDALRVMRGGDWQVQTNWARCAARYSVEPYNYYGYHGYLLGFRVAISNPPS